ncbi:MAG: hypothetical protein ABIR70_14790 [Bryobacteraceae bacterium]
MIIRITGTLEQTRTEPGRAEVSVGEHVQWLIEVAGRARSVGWEIYFEGQSPFRRRSYRLATAVQAPLTFPPSEEEGVHVGAVDAGAVDAEPGEYKYGVRAIDSATQRALSDDDPHIIVRRRLR